MRNIHDKDIVESVRELGEVLRELGRNSSLRDPIATAIEELQFTPPQIHTVLWLGTDGALTMGEIAARAGITEKTMTGVVDRLERSNYVQRERSEEDRRVVRVQLTRKGAGIFRRFEAALQERMYDVLSLVGKEERRCLIDIVQKIAHGLTRKSAKLFKTPSKSS